MIHPVAFLALVLFVFFAVSAVTAVASVLLHARGSRRGQQ